MHHEDRAPARGGTSGPTSSFLDPGSEEAFVRDGYVVVDLLDAAATARLRDRCLQLHPDPGSGFNSDFFHPDRDFRRRVDAELSPAIAGAVDAHLCDHRPLLSTFVINWPGPDGGLVLHQHTSVVDESRFRSLVAWVALNDATEENGTLHVVPRSHVLQRGPRPERSQSWSEEHRDLLMGGRLTSIPLAAGSAVLFDNQLVHCSTANLTSEPRMSVVSVITPRTAQPRYYEAAGEAGVRSYSLDREFFLTNDATGYEWPDPVGLPLLSEEPWTPTRVSAEVVEATVPPGTCRHV